MRNQHPGFLILLTAGWTLLLGTIAGAVLRWFATGALPPSAPDAFVWAFGFAIPLAVLAQMFVILWRVCWRRGRLRWRDPRRRQSALRWAGVCVLCGAALGIYSGGLGEKPGPQVGYLGLLPLLLIAMLLGARRRQALTRLVAFFVALELFAQLVGTWAQLGRFGYWDDITGIDVGFLLGGTAFWAVQALLLFRWRHARTVARRSRARPAPGAPVPHPRAVTERLLDEN